MDYSVEIFKWKMSKAVVYGVKEKSMTISRGSKLASKNLVSESSIILGKKLSKKLAATT